MNSLVLRMLFRQHQSVISPRRLSKRPCSRATKTNSFTYLPACDWQLYWHKGLFEFWHHFSLSLSTPSFPLSLWIFKDPASCWAVSIAASKPHPAPRKPGSILIINTMSALMGVLGRRRQISDLVSYDLPKHRSVWNNTGNMQTLQNMILWFTEKKVDFCACRISVFNVR